MSYPSRRYGSKPRYNPNVPRANKHAGECGVCGEQVEAGAGLLTGQPGSWGVKHTHAEWKGSPVSGRYVGGCPGPTADLNRKLLASRGQAEPEAGS